jgi:hypothetical protein
VWIEKNGLVLVVISEKVKGIKWFCVCECARALASAAAQESLFPLVIYDHYHFESLHFHARDEDFDFKTKPEHFSPEFTRCRECERSFERLARAFVCVES